MKEREQAKQFNGLGLLLCVLLLIVGGYLANRDEIYANRGLNMAKHKEFRVFRDKLGLVKQGTLLELDTGFYQLKYVSEMQCLCLLGPGPLKTGQNPKETIEASSISETRKRKIFDRFVRFIRPDDPDWPELSKKYFPESGG